MMHFRRIAAVVTAGLVIAAASPAQRRGFNLQPGLFQSSKVTVADEPGREPLELAKRAIETGDIDRALDIYQDILNRMPDRVAPVYLAPRTGTETDHVLPLDRYAGLRDHVMGIIRGLPGDALAKYREHEGRHAAELLERALAARDEAGLRQVVIRWYLTASGPTALAALSDLLFEDGRIAEAASHAERLLADTPPSPETAAVRARATLRIALAKCLAGDQAGFLALKQGALANDGASGIEWDGKPVPLSAVLDDLQARTRWPAPPPPLEKSLGSFTTRPWDPADFTAQEEEDDYSGFAYRMAPYMNQNVGFFPVIPVVTDTGIYFSDGLHLQGLSLTTRQPLWPPVEAAVSGFQGLRNWSVVHEVVLDRGMLFGCLENEPEIKAEARNLTMGFRPREAIAVRKLYAVDAQTGEVKWTHARFAGARDQDERSFIEKISVTSPPLILGDRLYAAATFYSGGFRHWLCCFDRDTGRLIWKTYVAQGQAELNMFGNPIKEVVPSPVGEQDGVVIYSTNIGVVAALDATTGSPRWITAYDQDPVPPTDGMRTMERAPSWTLRRPQFYRGKVYIAPSDSWHVYAFDVATGEGAIIPGASRNQQNPFRHLVGVYDGTLIISGREIRAFDVTGPKPILKWDTSATDGAASGSGEIEGRPAVAGDDLFYFRPYNVGGSRARTKLVQVNIKTGRLVAQKLLDGPSIGGNIVFSPDVAVVAGDHRLAAYFDVTEMATRLQAGIVKSPDEPGLRFRLGQILLQARDVNGAVAAFEKARTLAATRGPAGELVRSSATQALYNLMLELARDAVQGPNLPTTPADRFAAAYAYATTPRQQVQALYRQLIWSMEAQKLPLFKQTANRLLNDLAEESVRIDAEVTRVLPGLAPGTEVHVGLLAAVLGAAVFDEAQQSKDAVALYQQLLQRYADETIGGAAGGPTTIWRFAYERINAMIKARGVEVYADQEQAAQTLLTEGRAGNLDALRAVLDRFPNATIVGDAYLELSRRLREGKRDREALAAVQKQLARFGAASPALLVELARSLEGAQCLDSAREILLSLRDRSAQDQLTLDGKTVSVAQYVDGRLAEPLFADAARARSLPEIPLGLAQKWVEQPTTVGEQVTLVVPEGRRPPAADGLVLLHRDGEMRAVDLDTDAVRWRVGARTSENLSGVWRDGRLIALIDNEVVCIDPAKGTELWRASTGRARVLALHAAHGKVYLMLRDGSLVRGVIIRTFDIVSGERLRDIAIGSNFSGGDQLTGASFNSSASYLLVRLDANSGACAVLDAVTGEVTTSQPPSSQAAFAPLLSANNLLVSAAVAGAGAGQTQSMRHDLVLRGRNPRTGQIVWTFKLEGLQTHSPVYQDGTLLVIGTRSAADSANSVVKRELVVLDLTSGTTRFAPLVLRSQEISYAATVAGDLLLCVLGSPDGKRFVRAYELPAGKLLWDSITYSGPYLSVYVLPSKDYAIVRTGTRDSATDRRTDMIHLFENRSGLLKDAIKVENTQLRPGEADMELRDHALIIRGGAQVAVRR